MSSRSFDDNILQHEDKDNNLFKLSIQGMDSKDFQGLVPDHKSMFVNSLNEFSQGASDIMQKQHQELNKVRTNDSWVSKMRKAWTGGTVNDYSFNNTGNAGVPTLPYIYLGGSLYNPFLNIATIASYYSMYAQVTPVADAVDMIGNSCASIPILLKQKNVITMPDGTQTVKIDPYDPLFYKTSKKKKHIEKNVIYGGTKDSPILTEDEKLLNLWSILKNPNHINQRTLREFVIGFFYELETTGNAFLVVEYAEGVTREHLQACENVKIKSLRVGKTFEYTQYGYEAMDFYVIPRWREVKYAYSGGFTITYDQFFVDDLGNLRQIGKFGDPEKGTEKLYEIYQVNGMLGHTNVGQSRLLRCMQFINIHYLGALFTKSYFTNMGAPCAIVQVKPRDGYAAGDLSKQQKDDLSSLLRNNIKGASNAGSLTFWSNPAFELVYTPISVTVKEADVEAQMRFAEEQIYKAFHISGSLKSRSGEKYNILQEELRYYKEAIIPEMSIFTTALNRLLVETNKSLKEDNFFFDFDIKEIPEFMERETETVSKLMGGLPILKYNEARERLDLGTAGPTGDFIPVPQNYSSIEDGGLESDVVASSGDNEM